MEKLLNAAQAHVEKVFSEAQKSKPGGKRQKAAHPAARVLPKDYPVRAEIIVIFRFCLLDVCMFNAGFIFICTSEGLTSSFNRTES